ncbi:MAG TPA: PKD domain-containing protein, partial [Flavobacteriales bacterium]|nr:PKD domain-containing protein [Flavobacteriales bacterium]
MITATQDTCFATSCQWVTISGSDPCDGFDATITWNPAGNNAITFAGTTTVPGAYITWSFGDGTLGYGPTVTHTYTAAGQYHACLSAWYWNDQIQDSCFAEACVWVTVGGGNPCDGLNAGFSFQATGSAVNFQNTVVNNQWTYYWDFGDGTTGYGPNPVHIYTSGGAYYACLTVWAWDPVVQDTCFADHCAWVTVPGGDPCDGFVATFTWNPVGTNGAVFIGTTSLPASGIIWHFGDGTEGFDPTTTHIYAEPGQYHVCLTAWRWSDQLQDSCWAEYCQWVTIGGGTPCDELEACFESDQVSGTAFQFMNCTVPAIGVQFNWNFGDGSVSTEIAPDHNYQQPGTYTVCLTAYWGNCVDSTCTTVVVQGGEPCDGFVATMTWNASGNNSATLVGTTSLPAVGMIWHFGDGSQGFGQTATHTYTAPGQYHVCLTAWY